MNARRQRDDSSTSDAPAAGRLPATWTQRLGWAASASVLQFLVMYQTALMGLGWSGATYTIATRQSVAAFGVLVLIAVLARRPRWALIVPLLSAALTVALAFAWERYTEATLCSDAELAAVAELGHPPGLEVQPSGSVDVGCVANPQSELPPAQVHAHYRAEFAEQGWRSASPEDGAGVAAVKDGVMVEVAAEQWEGADGTIYMVYITAWDGCADRPQVCR
jgi:hypothetical protein